MKVTKIIFLNFTILMIFSLPDHLNVNAVRSHVRPCFVIPFFALFLNLLLLSGFHSCTLNSVLYINIYVIVHAVYINYILL